MLHATALYVTSSRRSWTLRPTALGCVCWRLIVRNISGHAVLLRSRRCRRRCSLKLPRGMGGTPSSLRNCAPRAALRARFRAPLRLGLQHRARSSLWTAPIASCDCCALDSCRWRIESTPSPPKLRTLLRSGAVGTHQITRSTAQACEVECLPCLTRRCPVSSAVTLFNDTVCAAPL